MKRETASRLRQQLRSKLSELDKLLTPVFESEPVFPGAVLLSRHRCGSPNCRCTTQGELHESVRLQIRFKDGFATRCLSAEEAAAWRPRTEAYRRARAAQRAFGKWQREVVSLMDRIERARRSTKGLQEDDRRRPLR